jgi:hypothetical protein
MAKTNQRVRKVRRQGAQFMVPEPVQMEALRELAMAGNMRAIREMADRLIVLDARYRPFAEKISELARGYQSKAVLRLVEKHTTQQQEEQVCFGARRDTGGLLILGYTSRHSDDWNHAQIRDLLDPLHRLQATHHRHSDIHQNQIRRRG